jgi:hypothetical protein
VPLIVEDGAGLATADAYASVSAYRLYWADRGIDVTADTDAKVEAGLRVGADYIDTIARYKAARLNAGQAREFPRAGLTDWSGYLVTGVPKRVQWANIELARIAQTETLYTNLDRGGRISAQSLGPISVSYAGDAPVGKVFRAAMQLLEPYVRGGSPDTLAASVVEGAPAALFAIGMHDGSDG